MAWIAAMKVVSDSNDRLLAAALAATLPASAVAARGPNPAR